MADDWDAFDEDDHIEIPLVGSALDSIEDSIGVPHKYRSVLNIVLIIVLIYLIVKFIFKKKQNRRYYGMSTMPLYRPSLPTAPAFVPPQMPAQKMRFDVNQQRWLVDVGNWCSPAYCTDPRYANELCSYTCGSLPGMNTESLEHRTRNSLIPVSMS